MKAIVAVDQNWAIGRENRLLVHLPQDLRHFKAMTMGHPVLLGRKTLETFPGGRPLPGRTNFILTQNRDLTVEGAWMLHSVEEAREQCPADTFVIGGESVYRAMLEWCDTVYVTRLEGSFPADTWFPDLDALPMWQRVEEGEPLEENGVGFRYMTYRKKGVDPCI